MSYDTAVTSYPDIQYVGKETDTGFKVRVIGSGTATMTTIGTYNYWAGPQAGQTVAVPDAWQNEDIVAATQAFTADDYAIRTEWAGVAVPGYVPDVDGFPDQDTLQIVDATHVLYERTGVTGTYVVTDGALVVTSVRGVFSYARLFVGPQGEDRWLNTKLVDGVPVWAYDAAVVKVTPGLGFTAASMPGDYQSDISVSEATGTHYYFDLMADGTGGPSYSTGTSDLITPLGTWSVASDGTYTFTRYYCNDGSTNVGTLCTAAEQQARVIWGETRTWSLLATSGSKVYVMEHLVQLGGTLDDYRINVYTKAN